MRGPKGSGDTPRAAQAVRTPPRAFCNSTYHVPSDQPYTGHPDGVADWGGQIELTARHVRPSVDHSCSNAPAVANTDASAARQKFVRHSPRRCRQCSSASQSISVKPRPIPTRPGRLIHPCLCCPRCPSQSSREEQDEKQLTHYFISCFAYWTCGVPSLCSRRIARRPARSQLSISLSPPFSLRFS